MPRRVGPFPKLGAVMLYRPRWPAPLDAVCDPTDQGLPGNIRHKVHRDARFHHHACLQPTVDHVTEPLGDEYGPDRLVREYLGA